MTRQKPADRVAELLDEHGRTYAAEAGIRLRNQPDALYQLLVLATLLSARISAKVAIAAARELFAAGCTTPERMRSASWQDRVDALGRGHYRRYDERTATMLGEQADYLLERWNGDLRRLREEAGDDPKHIKKLLTEFKGIGPTGADIFVREVQAVWPKVGPYLDGRVRAGAEKLGLPSSPDELAKLVSGQREFATLSAAVFRAAHDRR